MSAPPAYAPTTTTSYSPANARPQVNFHEEVQLSSVITTNTHKAVYDGLCELYSILTVAQMVETAFVKDFIVDKEKYTATVMRLVNQSQILISNLRADADHERVLRATLPDLAPDYSNVLRALAAKFNLDAPLGIDRLTKRVPATVELLHKQVETASQAAARDAGDTSNGTETSGNARNTDNSGTPGNGSAPPRSAAASARLVAEATGNFITLMDALKLDYNTKSQLHPLLSNLVISLNELVTRESSNSHAVALEFPGKSKLVSWLIKLNNFSDSDSLSTDDSEAFLLDLDTSYRGFYDSLE